MRTHRAQVQSEPNRPISLADQDVSALIGLLAILEGATLFGEIPSPLVRRLCTRLSRYGLLRVDADHQTLARALSEMNQRLRVARGEYDGVP
jgi:hypothetical protein